MKKRRFGVFYIILLLFIVAACLLINTIIGNLKEYLADYENAQPEYVAQEVFERYYKERDFLALIVLSGIKVPEYESDHSFSDYLKEKYKDCEVTYGSSSELNGDAYKNDTLEYSVKFGDSVVSQFTIKKNGGKSKQGFDLFEQGSFKLFFEAEESAKIMAPAGYTVLVNGREIASDSVLETGIKTDSCNHMPQGVEGVTFCIYEVKELLKQPYIKVLDKEGKEAPAVYDEAKKLYKADILYSDVLKEQYSAYVLEAAKKYACYIENDESLENIKGYFDQKSNFYKNIRMTMNEIVIPHSGYSFTEEKTAEFYAYDENTFSCRVSFNHLLHKKGRKDFVDKIDMTLYLRKVNGNFVIYDRFNNN